MAELRSRQPSFAERTQDTLARALEALGVDERHAYRIGGRATAFLNDLTPAGNVYQAQEATRAAQQGRWLQALGGSLMAVAPIPAPARKAAKKFVARVYHGSPSAVLDKVAAAPAARQFDNATSQFGAFFSPNAEGARRYAGDKGRVYETHIELHNPHEMSWGEFAKLQAPEKAADGSRIPPEMWGRRIEELKQEAARLRESLVRAGHDGVIVRGPRGDIKEIASFADVPLPKR